MPDTYQYQLTAFENGKNMGYETVTGREEMAARVAELLADYDKVEVIEV